MGNKMNFHQSRATSFELIICYDLLNGRIRVYFYKNLDMLICRHMESHNTQRNLLKVSGYKYAKNRYVFSSINYCNYILQVNFDWYYRMFILIH